MRRHAKKALREAEDLFRLFVQNVREYALVQSDPKGIITAWNPGAERLFGYPPETVLGRAFSDLLTPEDVEGGLIRNELLTLAAGNRIEDGRWFVRQDGTRFWALSISEPIRDEESNFVGVARIMRDETARQHGAELLREKESQVSAIFEQAAVGLSELSLDGRFLRANHELCRILGRCRDDVLQLSFKDVTKPDDIEHSLACVRKAIETLRPVSIDKRYCHPDGTAVWANSVVTPLADEQGRPQSLLVVTADLTERQRTAEALRVSLAEKEELLKEVHHRVKNNLQVIVSLITMQALQVEDEKVQSLFEEMRNRVLAISSIHELLYRAKSFANIMIADYARQLAPGLVRFYDLEERVSLEISGDTTTLELERAVPFGMLLNELVSNACKHAFPAPRGVIKTSVWSSGPLVQLVVADIGQGLPERLNYHQLSSIGLTLVHALVRQLRGTIEVRSVGGTTVTVQFPAKAEASEQ